MIDCKINKELKIGTKIIFFSDGTLTDGEKTPMDKGDISFTIKTDKGLCKIKHRQLDLYYV